jgi:hypothetical protein
MTEQAASGRAAAQASPSLPPRQEIPVRPPVVTPLAPQAPANSDARLKLQAEMARRVGEYEAAAQRRTDAQLAEQQRGLEEQRAREELARKKFQAIRHAIELDPQKIAELHEGSEQLQERLLYQTSELPAISVSFLPDEPDVSLSDSSDEPALHESAPDVDEDWREIAQKWKAEHWEIIVAVWQGHTDQVDVVARRVQRPVSRLIDEINEPVAEQRDDVLIEPGTLTIPEYFHEEAEKLTRWYLASRAG